MIVVQTPLRISFFGGGTDFQSFYQAEGGCVLSAAIDKYIYLVVKKRFDEKIRVGYTRTEMVDSVDEVQHELIREALRKTGITKGIEITTMGDIPAAGSGLGSSSTVTVGALQAMYTYLGEIVPARQLAKEACDIEIGVLGKPIGIQDQFIAAYGGLRFFEIREDGSVSATRVNCSEDMLRKLNESLMLFFTGITRQSSTILAEQSMNIQGRIPILRELKKMAYVGRCEIEKGNIGVIGEMLHESWLLKKELASQISNDHIDEMYLAARQAGAIGGKLTGAGGGGFMLLVCPHDRQDAVRQALKGYQEMPFLLEPDGTKVILNYRR
jgi:D-glycero-alpha-D-manno-heptose-7-phosphate kinase